MTNQNKVDSLMLSYFLTRILTILPFTFLTYPYLIYSFYDSSIFQEVFLWGICGLLMKLFFYMLIKNYIKQHRKNKNFLLNNIKKIELHLSFIIAFFGLLWGYQTFNFLEENNSYHIAIYYSINWIVVIGFILVSTYRAKFLLMFFPPIILGIIYSSLYKLSSANNSFSILIIMLITVVFIYYIAVRFQKFDREKAQLYVDNIEKLKAIEHTNEYLEKTNKDKSNFLAVASHDLKQPIHSLVLFCASLKKKLKGEHDELISDIVASTEYVSCLLDNLLDLSRLDYGGLKVKKMPVYVEELLRQLKVDFLIKAEHKKIDLIFNTENLVIDTDPELFYRIMSNLLDNAIKYTNQGSVTLESIEQDDLVIFNIIDTGIGIPAAKQEIVFKEFTQLNDDVNDVKSGVGLGLSICSRLIESLGHKMSLVSKEGKGTSISVMVSKHYLSVQSLEYIENLVLKDKIVLILDKDEDNIKYLRNLLESWNAMVFVAATLDEVEIIASNIHEPLSLIICDHSLKDNFLGINFLDLVRDKIGHNIPSVILVDEKNSALNEYDLEIELKKPVSALNLANILDESKED